MGLMSGSVTLLVAVTKFPGKQLKGGGAYFRSQFEGTVCQCGKDHRWERELVARCLQ